MKARKNLFVTISTLSILLFFVEYSTLKKHFFHNVGTVYLNLASKPSEKSQTYAYIAENAFYMIDSIENEEHISVKRYIGFAQLLQGQKEKAVSIWQEIPNIDNALILRGDNSRANGDIEEAVSWYQLASEVQPDRRDVWFYIGSSFSGKGEGEIAISYYEKALSVTPLIEDTVTDSEIYCSIGWAYHWLTESRDPVTAKIYYDLGINSQTRINYARLDNCYFLRASLFMGYLNDVQSAINDYESALLINPTNIHAKANLILATYNFNGDFLDAERDLLILVENNPQSIYGYWRLGDLYVENEMINNAIEQFEKALMVEPDNTQLQARVLQIQQITSDDKKR